MNHSMRTVTRPESSQNIAGSSFKVEIHRQQNTPPHDTSNAGNRMLMTMSMSVVVMM